MKVNRRQLFALVAALVGVMALCVYNWIRHPEIKRVQTTLPDEARKDGAKPGATAVKGQPPIPKPDATALKAEGREMQREAEIWKSLLGTSITLYGEVIDESNNPISGANVSASLTDHMYGENTKLQLTTDARGLFRVSGHGLGVVVMVSKGGYYNDDASNGSFTYAEAGGDINSHTDPNKPAIFVLRRKGTGEKLVKTRKIISFRKDGAPINLDLANGMLGGGEKASVMVEVWTNDNDIKPNSNQSYDWRCRLTVPGGGVIQRNGAYDFSAPGAGYAASDEIDMPASMGKKWRNSANRQYFVKFSSNHYARIEFDVIAGGDHFFIITSSINPTPGSLNLEDDSGQ